MTAPFQEEVTFLTITLNLLCAGGGIRTRSVSVVLLFESRVSRHSTTPAQSRFFWFPCSDDRIRTYNLMVTLLLLFSQPIIKVVCSLDFVFTISYDLGISCKVSTHRVFSIRKSSSKLTPSV